MKNNKVENQAPYPPWRIFCLGLLTVALTLNISVLFIPFMELRLVLDTEPYTIFHTVQLLWIHHVYILAVMVFAFSICFPFVKLLVLYNFLLRRSISQRRIKQLRWVERLAKWSMLDVFLVVLVLTVTHDQMLVGSTPREGLLLFVLAITLSMVVGQITCAKVLPEEVQKQSIDPSLLKTKSISAPILGTAGMVLFLLAITLPFLQTSDWRFSSDSYSLVSILPTLWKSSSPVSALVVFFFILLAPFILQCAILLQSLGKETGVLWEKVVFYAKKWSMVEVFALALIIFLIESSYLVHSIISWGGILLGIMVILYTIAQALSTRNHNG